MNEEPEFINAKDLADTLELARLIQTSKAVQEFVSALLKFKGHIDPHTYDKLNCKLLGINLLSDAQYNQRDAFKNAKQAIAEYIAEPTAPPTEDELDAAAEAIAGVDGMTKEDYGYPHLDQGWEYMREQAKAAIETFQKMRE